MNTCKVLGVGSPILDLLAKVDETFLKGHVAGEKGGMNMVSAEEQQTLLAALPADTVRKVIGGSAFNTISALTVLGIPTAFLGKLGTDDHGDYYRDAYTAAGGDASHFRRTAKAPTAACLSLVTPDSERTMRTHLGASSLLVPEEITDADFAGVTHVHLEGYMLFLPGVVEQTMKTAKKHGCTISFDLASFEVVRIFRESLMEWLPRYVDIVFANEEEARDLLGPEDFDPESGIERLHSWCPTAVIKLGKKGALMQDVHEKVFVPAKRVNAVDTTGAGDLWQAGFLYGYLTGCSLRQAGKMGTVLGSEIVQVLGAVIPADHWENIRMQFNQIKGS